ncbi:Serine/threonine-protein phosphatase 7 long form homolog, partial [Linum perenne]
MVTAWIERWRPETNTFHLVPGKATITLEDVEVLTGLPTTGRPLIVSSDERPVTEISEQWLGVQPPANAIQGRTVRVAWVKRLFDRLPDGALAEVITYHARAYTWVLVAGVLLADRNGDHIQVHLLQLIGDPRVASTYSWGSAVLAWLYKVMGRAAFFSAASMRGHRWRPETNTFHLVPGKAIITLEDVEVLTGLPTTGRPLIVSPDVRPVTEICEQWLGVQPPANAIQGRTVRVAWVKRLFDRLPDGATAEWMPYADRTEEFALDGYILWWSVTPLLCIDCIAWHHSDRCIQQFGFDQRVPQEPEPARHVEGLLAVDFRSSVTDWVAKYQQFVLHWEQRDRHIAT